MTLLAKTTRKKIPFCGLLTIASCPLILAVHARAGPAQAVKKASARQLYDEVLRRTTNILGAPAEYLTWSKLKFAAASATQEGATFTRTVGVRSVYDDSTSQHPSASHGPLTGVPDAALSGELTERTANIRKTMYGTDRRMDLFTAISKRDEALKVGASAVETTYIRNADAVGFILDAGLMRKLPSGDYYVSVDVYGVANHLCKVENFWDQPYVSGIGTGFLISADRLCTAGHCVPDSGDISHLRVIFGYDLRSAQIPQSIIIKAEDVYAVKQVINRQLSDDAEDWALLQLDRASTRPPLQLGGGRPLPDTRVFAIGYPSGLPMKISPNAVVRSAVANNGCFVAAVDACGGSSGSPIMSENTGEVEGILVRGDRDFRIIPSGECLASVVINDAHAGESICSIAAVRKSK